LVENLVNDLLDLAKIESNTFQFVHEYFDLAMTVKEAFDILSHTASERKIKL